MENAATVQKPESPADGGQALHVDNGDAGEHVVKEKGAGLAAAAGATAELEEATTDAKPSGETFLKTPNHDTHPDLGPHH